MTTTQECCLKRFLVPCQKKKQGTLIHSDFEGCITKYPTGFSMRASGWRNSLAISHELAACFSLEITLENSKIQRSVQTL